MVKIASYFTLSVIVWSSLAIFGPVYQPVTVYGCESSANTANSTSLFFELFVNSPGSAPAIEDDLRWLRRYTSFPEAERLRMREEARRMFEFGYDNYIKYAFPLDELDPIHCTGRGPDYENPSNININDVLGDYSLTLIDSLTTLVVMGNVSEFRRAVKLVVEYVNFEKDNTVQVFEATIRVIGALLSAHMIIIDPERRFGDFSIPDYDDELLHLAHDLASRLLPAFDGTKTALPYPRVNLIRGVPPRTINETCTSGAGSLLLEFGVLSRLLGDPTFEGLARRTNKALWRSRDKDTGLFGNVIDIQTGEWVGMLSGLGAGIDSFYEYLLKAYILFGDIDDYRMFNETYSMIKSAHRRGRAHCNLGEGEHPMYVNVHMRDRTLANTWIDSLQASFAGVQILAGDVEEAICQHALYYGIWKKYGVLPERFNWQAKAPDVAFYPLRPEFAESTYLLYMATKNPFYLHVGKEIIESLNRHTKVVCGYATVHNVDDKSLEDRMESFFLSETCKYLYLLFDAENPVNRLADRILFTTEGHIFPIDSRFRDWPPFRYVPPATAIKKKPLTDRGRPWARPASRTERRPPDPSSGAISEADSASRDVNNRTWNERQCEDFPFQRRFTLPLRKHYLEQLYQFMELHTDDYLPPEPWDIL